jgi:hypothetical protein
MHTYIYIIDLFFILAALGFELRDSPLLGKHSYYLNHSMSLAAELLWRYRDDAVTFLQMIREELDSQSKKLKSEIWSTPHTIYNKIIKPLGENRGNFCDHEFGKDLLDVTPIVQF